MKLECFWQELSELVERTLSAEAKEKMATRHVRRRSGGLNRDRIVIDFEETQRDRPDCESVVGDQRASEGGWIKSTRVRWCCCEVDEIRTVQRFMRGRIG